jgi:hypothetical protein
LQGVSKREEMETKAMGAIKVQYIEVKRSF